MLFTAEDFLLGDFKFQRLQEMGMLEKHPRWKAACTNIPVVLGKFFLQDSWKCQWEEYSIVHRC